MRVVITLVALLFLAYYTHADSLEVGGSFTAIGHFMDTSFARYNGWYWDLDYHIQLKEGYLTSMCDLDEQGLMLGGQFVSETYGNPENIIRIFGQVSIAFGQYSPTVDGAVNELICKGGAMTIVGDFATAGDKVVNNVVKWNARHLSWSYFGNGTNGPIYAATTNGDSLYIGGSFTQAGGVSVTNLAEWDGKKWISTGLCLTGVVNDILYYNGVIFIAGNFTVCNTNIRNFVIYNGKIVLPSSGINGTIRSFFSSKTKVFASGNFGREGLDEVRMWDERLGWDPIDDVYFVGQVFAVAYYNSESTYAVGGNFTQIIVGGELVNASYLVVFDEVGWHTIGYLNGPVRFIYSSVTSYVDFVILAIVASAILVICAGIILIKAHCIKVKTKKQLQRMEPAEAEDEEEDGFQVGAGILELPPGLKALRPVFFGLMGFIAICVILNIALMIIARKRLTLNLQSLLLVSHLWSAESHVSILIGFMLSIPLLACPVLIALLIKSHSAKAHPPSYKLSAQFRGIGGQMLYLAGFIFCLVVFLFYFLFTPPPRILAENSLVISLLLVACQLIADGFNLSAIDENFHGDIGTFITLDTTVHITTRIATATLLAVSPAISTALSVFSPGATFLVTHFLLWGNYRYSRKYGYEMLEKLPDFSSAFWASARKRRTFLACVTWINSKMNKKPNEQEQSPIMEEDQDEHDRSPRDALINDEYSNSNINNNNNNNNNENNNASISFWILATVFKLRPTEILNTEHRSVLLHTQLQKRIADFFFLQGYSTITPILLLVFTIVDLLAMKRHSTHLGGHFPTTTLWTLFTCLLVSPLSPGLFVSLSAPVTLPAIFAITLLCWTYITFFIGGHKTRKWIAVQEGGNAVLGLGFLIAAWEYAEGWSAKIPLYVLTTYASILLLVGFIYVVSRLVIRLKQCVCGRRRARSI